MLACEAVEVIYCPASLANSPCHVAVREMNAVSISLMSCSPSHPLGDVKPVKWEQYLLPGTLARD